MRDTAAVLDLLEQVPAAFTARQRGLAWLTGLGQSHNVDTASRRLLALAPQFSAPESAFLLAAQNRGGGWGIGSGYLSDPLDTALAVMALPQVDPAPAIAFLLGAQRNTGAWSMQPSSRSSVSVTLAYSRWHRPANAPMSRLPATARCRGSPPGRISMADLATRR